ncbi:hypothetical protein P3G55_18825 [Leptospira sp. 96542]|nr:hypothetical protein [Leptospira sp. 96542]
MTRLRDRAWQIGLRARHAVAGRMLRIADAREPDFIIGGRDNPYLLRWWVIPRNPIFNVYLHCFKRSDDDRALHDHPWLFNASWLLSGGYLEHLFSGVFLRREGAFKFRWGGAPHRVELMSGQPVWTLFITGPRVRRWGFYCPQGWVHWKRFTAASDSGAIGRGCEP